MFFERARQAMERDQQLAALVCPSCGEQNRKGRLAMVELDMRGGAFCNSCSYQWCPQPIDLTKGSHP